MKNINQSSAMIQKAEETFDVIFGNIDMVGTLVQEMIEKVEEVDGVATNVAAISEEQYFKLYEQGKFRSNRSYQKV